MSKKNENESVGLNIRNIPRDLRRRFKTSCADKDMNMSEVVVHLIQMYCDGKVRVR